MVSFSELRKMEVISADGKVIGTVQDVAINDKWNITGFTVKLDNDVAKGLGKQTPVMSALRLEVGVQQIKSIGDKVVLWKPLKELGEHLTRHEGVDKISRFLKMQVLGTGGMVLGQVEDVQLEPSTWKMPSLFVSLDRDVMDHMKMKKPFIGKGRLAVSMFHVSSIKDYVMLNTDRDGLARMLESSPVKKD